MGLVALVDLAAFDECADVSRDRRLSGVRTHLVHARQKRAMGAQQPLQRQPLPDPFPQTRAAAAVEVEERFFGTILPGSKHAPVKISPPNVHLRVEGTKYQFVLPIDKTDLIEQLSQMSLDSAPAPTNTEPATLEPQSPSAQPTPSSTVSPKPTPTAPSTATSTDAVMLMRDTLRNSPLKEFSTSQITTWSAGPQETIDGESFATGIISYEAKTILGQKSMQAKALIKNGSIQKWIHAKSGIEIK